MGRNYSKVKITTTTTYKKNQRLITSFSATPISSGLYNNKADSRA